MPDHARVPDLQRLQRIMRRLRGPDGCPWDRQQTLESLKHYLVEETYEVLEVMGGDDPEAHREELGDLLFQVVFQTQIRDEAGDFALADVVDVIAEKLERLPPSGEVPSSIMPVRVSLNRDFGVVSGEPNQLKSPLRVLAEATVSGPPTWRYWATNLMLGLVVGLLLPTALSFAYFVVRGDN